MIGRYPSSCLPRTVCAAVMLALFAVGCTTVRLVSDYDEPTDRGLTSLQQKVDDFIVALGQAAGSSDAAFERHEPFYMEVDRDLRQLEFRVESIPNNGHTQRLVRDIRAVLLGDGACDADGTSLKDLHCNPDGRERGPSPQALMIGRRSLNQTISAALSLELAKKQGLERNE